MTGLQIFALIVLPIVVAALGWIIAFALVPRRRAIEPKDHPLPGTHRSHV